MARLRKELAVERMEKEVAKKGHLVLCQGVAVRYAFLKSERLPYPLGVLCRVFDVSRSGFYAWLDRFETGRDRIVRLCKELGLRCRPKRRFKATTNSRHDFPIAEDLLNQTFTPTRPSELWVTDITYILTDEG